MFTLQGKAMVFSLAEDGTVASLYNRFTCHEYVFLPGGLWKLIYREGERQEIPVFSTGQAFRARAGTDGRGCGTLELAYDGLQGDGRRLDVALRLEFTMEEDRLSIVADIASRDGAEIVEFALTAASGVRSLAGKPEEDSIAWPVDLGRRLRNPAFSDLSRFMGFRKYERHDQFHTDMDALYPGRASMQWFDLYNGGEGLYVGSHDASHQTTCLHAERDVKTNVLRLGVIRYPFLSRGGSWRSAPVVYAAHAGDWHAGSRIYRTWMEGSGWTAPVNPQWVRNWKGWLRVILKQHHGEVNWDYAKIPALFDEARAAGLDTIFLLGWERGGFARMWPDYFLDEGMGGEKGLRDSLAYVHSRGGRVFFFLSYFLIDRESEFYKKGGGDRCTLKSVWGQEIPFSETYCGEGTWRKIANPPMPMYGTCPSAPGWQARMAEAARYCLDLGGDGVLYDIGGYAPLFCFDKDHPHAKPSLSCASKAEKYRGLKETVKERNPENAIMMEHNVDIFASHMDISQGASTVPSPDHLLEMYRYTFPEAVMTNRECGQDEEDYLSRANYSFLYGLRFDMTIYRCCGTLSDVPNYAAYLSRLNALRDRHAAWLLRGRFVDGEGFRIDNPAVRAKAYRADDGSLAVAAWNPTAEKASFTLGWDGGKTERAELEADSVAVYLP